MTDLAAIAAALVSEKVLSKTLGDGSGVIVDLDGSHVLSLNETGMFIVDQIQAGAVTKPQLVEALTAEFEVDKETARVDLDSLVDELGAHLIRTQE